MRLNRVLLLAASVIFMVFAMVFTISCSGDDGKDGSLKSCTLQTSTAPNGGVDVICEGTNLGNIPPGPRGEQGLKGEQGPAGVAPPGVCQLGTQDPITQKWSIVCNGTIIDGGEITGTLDGCKVDKSASKNFQQVFVCGNEEIYFCSGKLFDPEENHCAYYDAYLTGSYTVGTGSTYYSSAPIGVIKKSVCGPSDDIYDMRYKFCDMSVGGYGILKELCGGKNGEPYRTGTFWKESCRDSDKKVVKQCGTTATAPYYIIASQFCMSAANPPIVKERCGSPDAEGVYGTGKFGVANIDRTYQNSTNQDQGKEIRGEYNTADGERCENGKVVKLCGTELYEERTHFCAVGDVVAPHCTDRRQYDPSSQYCSFMANTWNTDGWNGWGSGTGYPSIPQGTNNANNPYDKARNIEEYVKNGFWNFGSNTDDATGSPAYNKYCDQTQSTYDPTHTSCLEYASTAIEFCGFVPGSTTQGGAALAPTVNNTPNMGAWKWEYCRDLNPPIASGTIHTANRNGTIIRCSELQIPPLGTSNTCVCIADAIPISATTNGCKCIAGFSFKKFGNTATGRWNLTGADLNGTQMWTYDGGECVPGRNNRKSASCTNTSILVNSGTTNSPDYTCVASGFCGANSVPMFNFGQQKAVDGVLQTEAYPIFSCTSAAIADPTAPSQSEVNSVCGGTDRGLLLFNGLNVSGGVNCISNSEKTTASLYTAVTVGSEGYKCAAGKVANYLGKCVTP